MSHANPAHYEPSNITFGIMPPLANPPRDKMRRKLALAERALADLDAWMARRGFARGRAAVGSALGADRP